MLCPKCRREVLEVVVCIGPVRATAIVDPNVEVYELKGDPNGQPPIEVSPAYSSKARHVCGTPTVSTDALDEWCTRRIEAASSERIRRWRLSVGLPERGPISFQNPSKE